MSFMVQCYDEIVGDDLSFMVHCYDEIVVGRLVFHGTLL